MLDSVTKKRIDNLRNILVGKITSPQLQIEQITTGLIYKFMYDMDSEAIEMGGVPSFFIDEYEKYSWKNLFNPKLGGVDKVKLYTNAIENLYNNPHAPSIFREIFKNSFLPFKDPSTLNMFLKEINEFQYSNSEQLGDAYEYLLSFMGSQGDAGQFRTPRHIIDFIIKIVNPQKNETILDPACGTSGFLISSYKHILNQNTKTKTGDQLNASERKQIGNNLVGYDIDPAMSKISLVNMYLHNFTSPNISEYDTLSSEDKWNEYFDIILANPPFFSPTGGIKPHSRFGVKSTRAEILFVDYIMEHLKPNGRAGIIVPEGIVFQEKKAYKSLRKKLVEDSLVAVISLPGGVFQPYSGVVTSILILDKEKSKNSNHIFFANISNDGFNLGAQRTPIEKNDLPKILNILQTDEDNPLIMRIEKEKIAQKGFTLSQNAYKSTKEIDSSSDLVKLEDICEITSSKRILKSEYVKEGIPFYRTKEIVELEKGNRISLELFISSERYKEIKSKFPVPKKNDILISAVGTIGISWVVNKDDDFYFKDGNLLWLRNIQDKCSPRFIKYMFDALFKNQKDQLIQGAAYNALTIQTLKKFKIPLPSIKIQKKIVDELDSFEKIIYGCRQVFETYKPTVEIDPSWDLFEFGHLVEIKGGKRLPKGEQFSNTATKHPYIRVSDFKNFSVEKSNLKFVSNEIYEQISRYVITSDDIYISIAGTIGLIGGIPNELSGANLTENAARLVLKSKNISKEYLIYISATTFVQKQIQERTHAVGVPKLALERIKTIKVPVPPIEKQNQIVCSIKKEIELINGNKQLIEIYKQKIQNRISKI